MSKKWILKGPDGIGHFHIVEPGEDMDIYVVDSIVIPLRSTNMAGGEYEYDDREMEEAHLIAAAPDLLEAAKLAFKYAPGFHDIEGVHYDEAEEAFNIIKAAIAKAEGR